MNGMTFVLCVSARMIWRKMPDKFDSEPPLKAFQIACGANYCAFWTGSETRLVRHEQVKRLSAQPKVSEKVAVQPAEKK